MKKEIIIGPIIFFILWLLFTEGGFISSLFLASPLQVFKSLIELFRNGLILKDILYTIFRLINGFILGAIFGIFLGIPIGYFKRIYSSLEILIDFFRSIPVASLFPLFLVFFGIGDTSKIATAAWSSFLIVLVNTTYGVKNVHQTRLMVAQTFNSTKLQIFSKIILPDSLPHIAAGLRISLSIAIIVVVMTEMFMGTNVGLGKRIYNTSLLYNTPELYATIFITGLLGYGLNKLMLLVEHRLIHW